MGRRHHVVAVIGEDRMQDGRWERAAVHRVSTSATGFCELTSWLGSFGLPPSEIRIGCEPTGGWCAETVVAWLERHGYHVQWLQNWALHERRQLAIGKQTKTDALDARLIARLLYEGDSLGHRKGFLQRAPRSTDALRLLVRNRVRLVGTQTRYRSQLTAIEDVLFPELKDFFKGSITGSAARHFLAAFATPEEIAGAPASEIYTVLVRQGHSTVHASRIGELQRLAADSAGLTIGIDPILHAQDWLLLQLTKVDEQIDYAEEAILNSLESWPADQRAVLDSFPCMSRMRQAVLISVMGDVAGFRHDGQLRKLLGWYPEARESGTTVSKHRLGRSGNRLARREIWLWALQLISPRHPPTPFRDHYQRLRARGVAGNVAMGHLAGKLISVLFFCLRRGQPYDPHRHAIALGLSDAF